MIFKGSLQYFYSIMMGTIKVSKFIQYKFPIYPTANISFLPTVLHWTIFWDFFSQLRKNQLQKSKDPLVPSV